MNNFRDTRAVVIYLKKYVSGRTVDYGAGSAKYRNLISPHASEYIAFDMKEAPNIDVVGDALKPPFEDNLFDTVISTQMLEHVEQPWIVASEIGRILKKGGKCIVTAPFMVPYHADPHDYYRYTVQGMESLFKNNGFEIVESGGYGKVPSVISEMIHFSLFSHYKKRSEFRQRWRDRFMRVVKWLAYQFDKLFKVKTIYANVYVVAQKK